MCLTWNTDKRKAASAAVSVRKEQRTRRERNEAGPPEPPVMVWEAPHECLVHRLNIQRTGKGRTD